MTLVARYKPYLLDVFTRKTRYSLLNSNHRKLNTVLISLSVTASFSAVAVREGVNINCMGAGGGPYNPSPG